jgi:hypothetical protein
MPATKTLPDCAEDALADAITSAADEAAPVVLWWDEGGYLEEIVRAASAAHDCAFRAAETTPLELRETAPRGKTVWYVPAAFESDVDWFRDVDATGGVVEQHIGKLAARCFEDDRLQAASLRAAYEDADVDPDAEADERDRVAKTLYEGLDGQGGLPDIQSLQTRIVLDGHDDPVQFVLEHGVEGLPEDDESLLEIRDLVVDDGVGAAEGVTDAAALVDRTRRWAVAEWLVEEGLDRDALPAAYQPEDSTSIGLSRPELQSVFSKSTSPERLAAVYLDPDARFWHDVLRTYPDPWELADCPVDGTLEHELWDAWLSTYRDGEYETCAKRARARRDRLETTYGDVTWTRVWAQAIEVAELAGELDAWTERVDTDDVVELYGDTESGTWQIDNAVFTLVVSGEPEADLPAEHPATASLDELRRTLTENRYLEYLSDLGDLVADQIESGAPFVDHDHTHRFFDIESEHLQSGESVALFIIDALRFDLAHQLAATLRDRLSSMEVQEDTWVGTLPSETSFGKAALTPGSKFSFSIGLDDGDLVPRRSGQKITNHRRKQLLRNDGWSYIMENPDESDETTGWNQTRVAYYWNDIDKAGEGELTDFEGVFSDRLDTIADIIEGKLGSGGFDRAYILTDHGFVSLPKHVDIDDVFAPDRTDKISRRWIAARDLDDPPGVRLDEGTQLGYLDDDTTVSVLTDPIQRFRNQGIDDGRFYHGGALPQEFVLNFVRITQE